MKERDATETAYNNGKELGYLQGYQQGVKDFAERVKARGCILEETGGFLLDTDDIDEIAKEMGCGE